MPENGCYVTYDPIRSANVQLNWSTLAPHHKARRPILWLHHRDLPWKCDGDDAAPRAHADRRIIESRHVAQHHGQRPGCPRCRNHRHAWNRRQHSERGRRGAATAGLVGVIYMPKGMMFTMGTLSMILAAGGPPAMTSFTGKTLSVPRSKPNGPMVIARPPHSSGLCAPFCASEQKGC